MSRRGPSEDAARKGPDPPQDGEREVMSTGQLADAVVHGTRWLVSARVFTEILLLASLVALARLIPPAEFGKFAIVLFMQELAVGVAGGFGNALVQRSTVRREHLQAGLAIVLVFQTVLVVLTVFVLAPLLFDPLFGSETAGLIQLAAPAWLLAAVTAIPQAVLQRRLDFRRVAQIQMASLLAGAATSLTLAIALDLDAEALVIGGIGAGVVATALSLLSAPCRCRAGASARHATSPPSGSPRRWRRSAGPGSATPTTPSSARGSGLRAPASTGGPSSSRSSTRRRSAWS